MFCLFDDQAISSAVLRDFNLNDNGICKSSVIGYGPFYVNRMSIRHSGANADYGPDNRKLQNKWTHFMRQSVSNLISNIGVRPCISSCWSRPIILVVLKCLTVYCFRNHTNLSSWYILLLTSFPSPSVLFFPRELKILLSRYLRWS